MLNKKFILILLALCSLLFAILFYTKDQNEFDTDDAAELFIPELLSQLGEVKTIRIDTNEQSVELNLIEELWLVKSMDHYPAKVSMIRDLMYGIAELTILEVKTSNVLLLGEIGLAQNDEESIRVRFFEQNQNVISDSLFGQSPVSLSQAKSNWFARQYQSTQAWLVEGQVPLEAAADQWIDNTILNLDAEELQLIHLQPETDEFIRLVNDNETDKFSIDGLTQDQIVDDGKISQVIDALRQLNFEDVRQKSSESFSDDAKVINIELVSGLMILVLITDVENGWAILQAIASTGEQSVIEKAEKFNQSWANWEYQLPKSELIQLLQSKTSFLKAED